MAALAEKNAGAPGEDSVLSYVDNMMLSIEEMDPSLSACAEVGVARVCCVIDCPGSRIPQVMAIA